MGKVYYIEDINTLMDAILADINSGKKGIKIEYSKHIDIRIKLKGEQWEGKINYQVANFIIELQKRIIKIYNNMYDANINFVSLHSMKNLAITISVDKGCTELLVHINDFLSSIKNMESKHILYAILGIALIYGGNTFYSTYTEAILEKTKTIEEEKTKREFIKITNFIVQGALHNPELEYLAKEMHQEDELLIGEKSFSKQEALTMFNPKNNLLPEVLPSTYYVDGKYAITIVYFKENSIKIALGGKNFRASTSALSNEDKDKLHETYKIADQNQTIPYMDLQVAVEVLDGSICAAKIVGIGPKRASAITLQAALKKSKETKESKNLQQGNLLDY